MKTKILQTERVEAFKKANNLLLTACMLICATAGWFLGSMNNRAFSQSNKQENNNNNISENNIILHSVPINGKTLPTIILREFSVVADKNI